MPVVKSAMFLFQDIDINEELVKRGFAEQLEMDAPAALETDLTSQEVAMSSGASQTMAASECMALHGSLFEF